VFYRSVIPLSSIDFLFTMLNAVDVFFEAERNGKNINDIYRVCFITCETNRNEPRAWTVGLNLFSIRIRNDER